jgi:hypothetical protein
VVPMKEITLRLKLGQIRALDEFASAFGTTRSGVIRKLVEDFTKTSGDLVKLLQSSKKGEEAEVMSAWVYQMLSDLEEQAQLTLPAQGRGGVARDD